MHPECQLPLPGFAAGLETLITLVIVLISFIGWIVNLISEKARQAQPRRANPAAEADRRTDDRFQQEIDQFLQQVGGRPRPKRTAPQEVEIEIVPEEELRRRRRDEQKKRKLSEIEDRHVASSHLGEGVGTYVDAHLNPELFDQTVRNDIGNRIEVEVETDFGESRAKEVAPLARAAIGVRPQDIVQMLRDRNGVRNAIVINEILKRRTNR